MPDEKTCREWLAEQRWNGKPACPYCGYDERIYSIEDGKRFKCGSKDCYKKFSVTVGTVFESSNIKLNKWLMALYLLTAHKKGISSYQLGKDIGVTQKTAWFMNQRLRTMMADNNVQPLEGIVEADETYMGRKYRSDYKGLSEDEIDWNLVSPHFSKGVVIGMAHPETKTIRVKAFPVLKGKNVAKVVRENIKEGSTLHTDESRNYSTLQPDYNREKVNHSKHEWVKTNFGGDKITINHVENFWSVMKRGLHGIYHQVSYKQLQRYCDEFSYRYNTRELKDGERFNLVIKNMERRLDYKTLTKTPGNYSHNWAE
jgi:transposase-like protein